MPVSFNWHTGASHVGNGGYRGTRRLDDPELGAVSGCERRSVGQCDEMGRYVLRLEPTRDEPGRLDVLRSGRVMTALSRKGQVGVFDLAAGRAAWVEGATLRVRGVEVAGSAEYALPTPPAPNYLPTKIAQTRPRVLVELASTAPGHPTWFYVGTIPRRLRAAERVAVA